jgi:transcriptional regulator GlxA family with amidase domain
MITSVVAVVGDVAATFELGIVEQVFGLDRRDVGLPTYDFDVAAHRVGAVPTASGVDIAVTHGPERIAEADLVVVPAWPQLLTPAAPSVLGAVRAHVEGGGRVLAICSGAFLLAQSGVLDGRRAATHWQFADLLRRSFPRVRVDADVLYVEDGPVITSAGAAAGVDACLHLVRTEYGTAVANALARRMVLPPHRAGGQAQFVETPVPVAEAGGDLPGLLAWVDDHLDRPLRVADLARAVHLSPRTFARHFGRLTGTTPHQYVLGRRLAHVEELLETTDLPVDAVARRAGFGSGDAMRYHFAARRGVGPAEYRRTFREAG